MKRNLISACVTVMVIVILTSCGAARRTTTTGDDSRDANRTTTNGINTRTGNATNQVVSIDQSNGTVVTLVPLYRGTRLQGWDVILTDKDGNMLTHKSYARRRYQDAYADAYNDPSYSYRSPGRGAGILNVVRGIYNYSQGIGVYHGYRQPF